MTIKELIKQLRVYDENTRIMITYEGVVGDILFVEPASTILDGKEIKAILIEGTE